MRVTTWLPVLAGVSWRRMGRAFLAVPVALAAVARAATARDRTIWRALAAVPVGLVATVVAAYTLAGLVLNLAYPVRYDSFPGNLTRLTTSDPDLHTAWGGPTLAGAWVLHAAIAVVLFGIGGIWVVRGLMNLQARLIQS